MTDPTNPDPTQGPADPDDPAAIELPPGAELSDGAAARLRARLRDEPVDDDDLARERRIRVALDAFTPVTTSTQGAVPAPRRGTGRALLVAAAVVAVMGVGGLFLAGINRSGGNDSASVESADSAATTITPGAAEDRAADTEASPDSADGSGGAAGSPSAAGSPAPTSTAPLDRSQASTAAVPDLGVHDDEQALLAALGAGVAGVGTDTPRSNDPAVLPCVAQQRAAGIVVLGAATVGGEVVVVIDTPAGPQLLDPSTCVTR